MNSKYLNILVLVLLFSQWGLSAKEKGELEKLAEQVKCVVPSSSSWKWSEATLAKNTSNIYIGVSIGNELTTEQPSVKPDFETPGYAIHYRDRNLRDKNRKWKFRVVKVLKGSLKEEALTAMVFSLFDTDDDKNNPASVSRLGCEEMVNFRENKHYLIFQNSFHPLGYRRIAGPEDPLTKKIESLIH